MPIGRYRARSGGGDGDGGTQYILVPNSDGTYPDAMVERLLLTREHLSIGHEQVHHATDPTGTFDAVTNANFLGVFVTGNRPSAAPNTGRRIFNKGVDSWQIAETDGWAGFQASGWANTSPPSYAQPWRGAHDSEAAALAHVQAAGDKVVYNDTLYEANSDFVAGTDRTVTLTWQPVDEGGEVEDLETLRYWQDGTAQSAVPNDASTLVDRPVGELVPLSFPMRSDAGDRFLHLAVRRPYIVAVIFIAGADRFSDFTLQETASDRLYHSPEVGSMDERDLLVVIREGAA